MKTTNLTPLPAQVAFKKEFIARYAPLTDMALFKQYSLSYLRKAIRVNTLKVSVNDLQKRLEQEWELTPIPWCKESFWIQHKTNPDKTDIGNLAEHVLGFFYVQEAASMLPPLVLDAQPGETVLDMCAAPGSKTTQIAAMMDNTGVLVANELDKKRGFVLKLNLQRCGVQNVVVTNVNGEKIGTWAKEKEVLFDRILVDAPCSATGTIRKSPNVVEEWNPETVKRISSIQKRLVVAAFDMLKKGGTLVYSTCTLEPEENEGVVSYLLQTCEDARTAEITLDIERSPPVTTFEGQEFHHTVSNCLRIWPQDNDTEGFFVAKIVKE